MIKQLTKGEYISLGHHLSIWPDDMTNFKTICDIVAEDHEDIVIWEPFEEMEKIRLLQSIMGLAETIDMMFGVK